MTECETQSELRIYRYFSYPQFGTKEAQKHKKTIWGIHLDAELETEQEAMDLAKKIKKTTGCKVVYTDFAKDDT